MCLGAASTEATSGEGPGPGAGATRAIPSGCAAKEIQRGDSRRQTAVLVLVLVVVLILVLVVVLVTVLVRVLGLLLVLVLLEVIVQEWRTASPRGPGMLGCCIRLNLQVTHHLFMGELVVSRRESGSSNLARCILRSTLNE